MSKNAGGGGEPQQKSVLPAKKDQEEGRLPTWRTSVKHRRQRAGPAFTARGKDELPSLFGYKEGPHSDGWEEGLTRTPHPLWCSGDSVGSLTLHPARQWGGSQTCCWDRGHKRPRGKPELPPLPALGGERRRSENPGFLPPRPPAETRWHPLFPGLSAISEQWLKVKV